MTKEEVLQHLSMLYDELRVNEEEHYQLEYEAEKYEAILEKMEEDDDQRRT